MSTHQRSARWFGVVYCIKRKDPFCFATTSDTLHYTIVGLAPRILQVDDLCNKKEPFQKDDLLTPRALFVANKRRPPRRGEFNNCFSRTYTGVIIASSDSKGDSSLWPRCAASFLSQLYFALSPWIKWVWCSPVCILSLLIDKKNRV
jgi:hypothetical protein